MGPFLKVELQQITLAAKSPPGPPASECRMAIGEGRMAI
jgi:hypothetical protein